jgi:hypothetical protein
MQGGWMDGWMDRWMDGWMECITTLEIILLNIWKGLLSIVQLRVNLLYWIDSNFVVVSHIMSCYVG